MNNNDKLNALFEIMPDAEIAIKGDNWHWLDSRQEPSALEYQAGLDVYNAKDYLRKRKNEYPPIETIVSALWEYVVNSDNKELDTVKALIDAVNAKYPKT